MNHSYIHQNGCVCAHVCKVGKVHRHAKGDIILWIQTVKIKEEGDMIEKEYRMPKLPAMYYFKTDA